MLDTQIGLDWSSYTVMGLYLLAVIAMGAWFRRGKVDTETYLLGGRSMPWFVIGISYFVSLVSTVSMVSGPGEAYEYGVAMAIGVLIQPIAAICAFLIFVRFYFKHRIFTPFDYLERRFDSRVREIVAGIFCLTRIIYLGMVLFASAKVLEGAAGWAVWQTIVVVGIIGIAYTVLGGLRAVVWTDVMQFVVLFGGMILIAGQIVASIPDGITGVIDFAQSQDHLFPEATKETFFAFDPYVRVTLWFLLITYFLEALFFNSGDQIAIQRLLSTSSYKQAWRSLLTFAIVGTPFHVLIYFVGLGIYVFYMQQPEHLQPEKGDLALFNFIATELPAPVPGLILSAMLAAAMSTLDSGMNSLATVITKDFYVRRSRPDATEQMQVQFSRWITFWIGVAAIFSSLGIANLADRWEDTILEAISIWSSFTALIAPIFLLGVTSRRLRAKHILITLVVTAATLIVMLGWRIQSKMDGEPISFLIVGPLTLVVALITGYGISLFLKPLPREETRDLTY